MTRSLLVRRRVAPQEEPSRAVVIVLHGENGQLDDLVPLALSLSRQAEVVAVEGPRRVHDARSAAYTWFYAEEPGNPEPVTLGDSLAQLEQLIYELTDSHPDQSLPLYLMGFGQGGLLALTIGSIVPDYLAGVVAICGSLPNEATWPIPDRALEGLPFLLIYDGNDPHLPEELVVATGSELLKRGGSPTLSPVSGARMLEPEVFKVTSEWFEREIK
jgi:phospholipase/carboxylesterase